MQRRILATVLTLLAILTLVVGLPGSAAAHDPRVLSARLSGANEVPPADPDGAGEATVTLIGSQVCFRLKWNGIDAPFAGHIHRGAAGVNGPIVVNFFTNTPATPLPARISSALGCTPNVDEALMSEIRANPAGFYVNLHNAAFPGGVIRGQLGRFQFPDIDLDPNLVALLLGRNEVPPADPDGFGAAAVSARGSVVCFVVSWTRIGAPHAAHIHRGAKGVNGPIVVDFFTNAPTNTLPENFRAVDGCNTEVDPALVAEIRARPFQFYVNVHTPAFPGGAIRGQLI
jgi:hypothetical protein